MLAEGRHVRFNAPRLLLELDRDAEMGGAIICPHHHVPRGKVGVVEGFLEVEDRREADVAAGEPVDPLGLGALGEGLFEKGVKRRLRGTGGLAAERDQVWPPHPSRKLTTNFISPPPSVM